MKKSGGGLQHLSVIVPRNPFAPEELQEQRQCLGAVDVKKLMDWWPGKPHVPKKYAEKVRAIQRSLDWKRVVQIAAYLLQREIQDVPQRLDRYFKAVYEPRKYEPGREWPPKIGRVIGYQKSECPTFANVLLHINGAKPEKVNAGGQGEIVHLTFDENDPNVNFTVIDGQHRINGAYMALRIRQEDDKSAIWEIPAEIFLDLDKLNEPPRRQAQIFIDVNFYQKKVDRSLVADLFPTARGRSALDNKERAQDIGRRLMLETGPLVGMVQIPGIKYGVKDVIALATLDGAIEDIIEPLTRSGIRGLDNQTEFIAQCLSSWFKASGRSEDILKAAVKELDPENPVYQSRVVVSVIAFIPAMIWCLKRKKLQLISTEAERALIKWLGTVAENAAMFENGKFMSKSKFRERGYLGSGGIGLIRDSLWAVVKGRKITKRSKREKIAALANENRRTVNQFLVKHAS